MNIARIIFGTAALLTVIANPVKVAGISEAVDDADWVRFTVGSGTYSLEVASEEQ